MSAKIMGMVFDLDLPHPEKLVLLAYADHADHKGANIYPSVELIAHKTNYSTRSVQYISRKLVSMGLLIPVGGEKGGRNRTREWRIPLDEKGAIFAPFYESKRVQNRAERVQNEVIKGAIAVAPESINHINLLSENDENKNNASSAEDNGMEQIEQILGEEIIERNRQVKNRVAPRQAGRPRSASDVREEVKQALEQGYRLDEQIKMDIKRLFVRDYNWQVKTGKLFLEWIKGVPIEQTLDQFAKWWYESDWRGQKGQSPELNQIRELWPMAFVTSVPRSIGGVTPPQIKLNSDGSFY